MQNFRKMKKGILRILAVFGFILGAIVSAQEVSPTRYTSSNKGKIYVYWGGNRDYYSRSDIHFKGEDYDFTLYNVKANDKPKGWHIDYINPGNLTIPQTNFKIGYYISDHYNIAIGYDHMKYVMAQDRMVRYTGHYPHPGTYGELVPGHPGELLLTEEFLMFEHTDGLNYVHIELNRVDDLSSYFGIVNTDKVQINLTEGVGIGYLYPKTNTTLMDKERYDEFHVSGWGASVKGGLNFTFFKHFFLQTELKGGYIKMGSIRTTRSKSDKASQSFRFLETIVAFGGTFRI